MTGRLTDEQIDHVLTAQVVGRIGCHLNNTIYIVPVAYAFDGDFIYVHSRVGKKIEVMRKNPDVCFQVDVIENLANWRSVVVNGVYEELVRGAAEKKALKLLKDRLTPFVTSEAAMPAKDPPPGEKKMRPVFFRIRILEKSGRYEKR